MLIFLLVLDIIIFVPHLVYLMLMAEHPIKIKLEAARRELLDLSLRNPLLNYRPLKSRGVDIVNEIPAEIYRVLVKEGKAMSFVSVNAQTVLAITEAPGKPEEVFVPTPAQTDNKLQTKETPEKLQARLLDTYHSARMFVEEQGVSILYLVLGTLTWYEADNSSDGRHAPLILVPVELERTTAREQFQLRYTGGEIGANLSLMARLKTDFGITITELPETEELNVTAYFDEVWRQVVGRKGWVINSKAVGLGFFSFGKFLMYNDLDIETWPDTAQPVDHPVLNALLQEHGFREPNSHIPDEAHLDAFVTPAETRQVVDADSSQTLAILDVNQGRNLVIQGPPGTGKSQTITNLIAEAIGKGKTVLFVAEKMAALEVVKRRLDKVGLGEACLELHSHKTNKKDLLKELQHTLDLGKPQLQALESEINLLTQIRNRLNDYADAINLPVGGSTLTMYDIYGRLIQQREKYKAVSLPRLVLPSLLAWSQDVFKTREALVQEVQARLQQVGQPTKLLFWGSQRRSLLPTELNRIIPAIEAAVKASQNLSATAGQLADELQLPAPEDYPATEYLFRTGQRLAQSPDYKGLQIRSADWVRRATEVEQLLSAGKKLAQVQQQHEAQLIPEAWSQNVLEIRQNLLEYGDKWWRFLVGAYRKSKKQLTGLTRTGLPSENSTQLALVDAILEAQRQKQVIGQFTALGQSLFGSQWHGETSDWPKLAQLRTWLTDLHLDITKNQLPAEILNYLEQEPNFPSLNGLLKKLNAALELHQNTLAELRKLLLWDDKVRWGEGKKLEDLIFTQQENLLQLWLTRTDELHQVVAWNILADRLQAEGLQEIINLSLTWAEAGQYLTAAFQQTWLEALLEKAYEERPALLHFERAGHEETIQKFSHLDHLLLAYNRARLAALHWQQLPQHQAGGQLGVLRREFEKKARHLPIRQLMTKAGKAIQTVKPVFMMGPLSIANFLPPEALQFDLVIFDEASQVKPVDAFGAILRAKQVVVVGDSKQMPPTSFFDALVKEEEAEEENIAAEVESVLGLFAAQGAPQRMLRWHYRSRHESLVAVSNQEFYDNRLVIFPSPDANRQKTGLIYHHLPETFYDRGKTRTNPQEAETVARAIMEHAKTSPELTLGVAAFSMAQMQAIINQLELLRRQDISAEPFFAAHPNEPFFIKNLENVQGDERDVIFISIGYGRTPEGYLSMSFGPLNGTGGERRLNVLITRARLRCEVFTNLSPDDIDLSRTQARGVQAFKTFLSYAKNGRLDLPVNTGREIESPFEEAVYKALVGAGYQVQTQVGSAGFFIDLAVVHPEQPGRYLLGIECDGANYHRARSARDRDRLRQAVLEGLGWQIYRIWSTDWFRHPEAEQKRLFAALEKALKQDKAVVPAIKSAQAPVAPEITRAALDKTNTGQSILSPYQVAQLNLKTGERELAEVPISVLAGWVKDVVQVESPVHVQEVIRRITEAAAVPRIGPRLRTALETAIATVVKSGKIRQEKDFLWLVDMQQPPLRDRSQLPAASKNIVYIAPAEIAQVIEKVVGESFGMPAEEIAPAVAKLLGFSRVTEDIREQLDLVLEEMVRTHQLEKQGSQYIRRNSSTQANNL